jgi:RNA recognition motif-containing protein
METNMVVQAQNSKMYKLFLGGTPFNCTNQEINSIFSSYGTIKKIYFPMDGKHKRQKGFCFLTLADESAYKQIAQKREFTIRDKLVIARECMNQNIAKVNEKALNDRKIFVCGIPVKNTND